MYSNLSKNNIVVSGFDVDKKVFDYLKDKPMSPKNKDWDKAVEYWSKLKSDKDLFSL